MLTCLCQKFVNVSGLLLNFYFICCTFVCICILCLLMSSFCHTVVQTVNILPPHLSTFTYFFTFCVFIVELIDFSSNQTHHLTLNISLKPSGRHFKKMILPPQSVEAQIELALACQLGEIKPWLCPKFQHIKPQNCVSETFSLS